MCIGRRATELQCYKLLGFSHFAVNANSDIGLLPMSLVLKLFNTINLLTEDYL